MPGFNKGTAVNYSNLAADSRYAFYNHFGRKAFNARFRLRIRMH